MPTNALEVGTFTLSCIVSLEQEVKWSTCMELPVVCLIGTLLRYNSESMLGIKPQSALVHSHCVYEEIVHACTQLTHQSSESILWLISP